MWVFLTRAQAPDARPWPGRRWFAAIDAIAWPLGFAWLTTLAPNEGGVFGLLIRALVVVIALRRLHRALRANHRYRFAAWRVVRIAAIVWVLGIAMQVFALQ